MPGPFPLAVDVVPREPGKDLQDVIAVGKNISAEPRPIAEILVARKVNEFGDDTADVGDNEDSYE